MLPYVTSIEAQKISKDMAEQVVEESGGSGTEVIANPELVGDESALSGLEVDGTKYKVAADITIDTALDDSSTNPVQNKVVTDALNGKQSTLVSGTNIKTINNTSILGSGNIDIQGNDKLPTCVSLIDYYGGLFPRGEHGYDVDPELNVSLLCSVSPDMQAGLISYVLGVIDITGLGLEDGDQFGAYLECPGSSGDNVLDITWLGNYSTDLPGHYDPNTLVTSVSEITDLEVFENLDFLTQNILPLYKAGLAAGCSPRLGESMYFYSPDLDADPPFTFISEETPE